MTVNKKLLLGCLARARGGRPLDKQKEKTKKENGVSGGA
jgi:hypothetical protein